MTRKAADTLKLARGTARNDRSAPQVKAVSGEPVRPEWLGDIASAKWDETIRILDAECLLSPTYGDFLTMYCVAWQDFHVASQTIQDDGEYCHSEKGGVYQHPAVGVRNKAIERVMKFGRQLGISAATIAHVHKTEKVESTSTKKRFFG